MSDLGNNKLFYSDCSIKGRLKNSHEKNWVVWWVVLETKDNEGTLKFLSGVLLIIDGTKRGKDWVLFIYFFTFPPWDYNIITPFLPSPSSLLTKYPALLVQTHGLSPLNVATHTHIKYSFI